MCWTAVQMNISFLVGTKEMFWPTDHKFNLRHFSLRQIILKKRRITHITGKTQPSFLSYIQV